MYHQCIRSNSQQCNVTVSDGTSEVDDGDLLGGDVPGGVAQLSTHVAKSFPQLVQVLLQGVLLYFQSLLLLLNTLFNKYSLTSSWSAEVKVPSGNRFGKTILSTTSKHKFS